MSSKNICHTLYNQEVSVVFPKIQNQMFVSLFYTLKHIHTTHNASLNCPHLLFSVSTAWRCVLCTYFARLVFRKRIIIHIFVRHRLWKQSLIVVYGIKPKILFLWSLLLRKGLLSACPADSPPQCFPPFPPTRRPFAHCVSSRMSGCWSAGSNQSS